mmetsp:Transcript_23242/g.38516  ORF Transcript_23242/g.38516 Transcript_23242/m.38516 type:complete len:147 (-) Transcript_23242:172-612(-)
MLIYGGTGLDPSPPLAHEADNTIYVPKFTCPSTSLLVHEIVHVWQEQSGYWNGVGGARRAFDLYRNQRRCLECLYDYGDYGALQSKMELALAGNQDAADVAIAFGSEQMAEIVEDYYAEWEVCQYSSLAPWYCEALAFYSNQIIIG